MDNPQPLRYSAIPAKQLSEIYFKEELEWVYSIFCRVKSITLISFCK